ncbi:MAG: helix-turn-helix domain-containing protein [Anaerolineales bacterium]|nr:helix-turn-helix domain-containing protein [Anaerolineales bacterium]
MFRIAEQQGTSPANTNEVRALSRGLCLLEILAAAPQGLALTDMAEKADLSKSSTHRLLHTLISNGYVLQNPSTCHYLPTRKLLKLSHQMMEGTSFRSIAHPHLRQLAETTGETAHLVLLENGDAVYVEKVESPNSIRMVSSIGMRVPLHCTGVGKAILAHLPHGELQEILETRELRRYTENTITNQDDLLLNLKDTVERGYAIDYGEHEEHVCCIAAPLFARTEKVIGAVSIAAVSYRVDLEILHSWWPVLKSHANQMNTELAFIFDRYI